MKGHRLFARAAALSLAFAVSATVFADEIVVPVGQQAAEKSSLARPKVGMMKAKVEAKFGTPAKCSDPVGKPPITSCDYPDYTVYYENDRVIHSVLKPSTDDTAAPAPAASTDSGSSH